MSLRCCRAEGRVGGTQALPHRVGPEAQRLKGPAQGHTTPAQGSDPRAHSSGCPPGWGEVRLAFDITFDLAAPESRAKQY